MDGVRVARKGENSSAAVGARRRRVKILRIAEVVMLFISSNLWDSH